GTRALLPRSRRPLGRALAAPFLRRRAGLRPGPGGARVPAPADPRARTATEPFAFFGCVELRQVLDRTADDERELMDRLEEVPADSIFYHTHGYFLRQRPVGLAYGNDFARW